MPTAVGRDLLSRSFGNPGRVAAEIEARNVRKRYGLSEEAWRKLPPTTAVSAQDGFPKGGFPSFLVKEIREREEHKLVSVIADPQLVAPAGRHMLLLQKWGAAPAVARDLEQRLIAAAGEHRTQHLDRLFDRMGSRQEWDGRRKLAWLDRQATKMAIDPVYWPAERGARAFSSADAMLNAVRAAPGGRATKGFLKDATGKSANSVATLTKVLVDTGELVRLEPGVFALPHEGANAWCPARELVLNALAAAPAGEATIAELISATGLTRTAVDAAIFRLIKAGQLIRVRRGVFELPPSRQATG